MNDATRLRFSSHNYRAIEWSNIELISRLRLYYYIDDITETFCKPFNNATNYVVGALSKIAVIIARVIVYVARKLFTFFRRRVSYFTH